jgi:hypothetical protein
MLWHPRKFYLNPFSDYHDHPRRGSFVIVAGMIAVIYRFIQHGDLRLVRDPDNSFWLSLNNGKRKGFAETHDAWNEDSVAYDHRTLIQRSTHEVLESNLERARSGADVKKNEVVTRSGVNLRHDHLIADLDSGVFPNDRVHAEKVLTGILGPASPVHSSRDTALSVEGHNVAGVQTQTMVARHASPPVTDVGGYGRRDDEPCSIR